MKPILYKIKKYAMILMVMFCVLGVSHRAVVPAYAYTREEIDAAKAWLSANGYSPDAGGAAAAYADYMNGKFGAIPGLPEPNNASQQPADNPQQETPEEETSEEESEKEKPKDDSDNENSQTGTTPESTPVVGDASSQPSDEPDETATQSQQEFADMIDVFAENFSADEQEEIDEAKARLERQKQERAAAEQESEEAIRAENKPQKNIIIAFCAVLTVALSGLGILIRKKKSEK